MAIKHLTFDNSATVAAASITASYETLLEMSDDADFVFIYNTTDAAIGATATRVQKNFTAAPIVCESGRFVAVILRMPVATATASQVVQGLVGIDGFYE